MKKTISLMLVVIITLLSFTSCASSDAKKALEGKLDALISGDYDAINFRGSNESQTELSKESEDNQKKMWDALFGKMTYEIGKSTVDGNKAKVEVKIYTIDMAVIKNEYFVTSMKYMFNDSQWDPNGEELLKLVTADDAKRGEFTTTVNMTKENDGWSIDDENSGFYNALLGGMNGSTNSK